MTPTDEPSPLTPAQASLTAAALEIAAGDIISVDGGILTKVHHERQCAGTHCWVHNPSEHHMVTWPIRWRADTRTAERLCSHRIGHPDPDDVAFNARGGSDVTRHSCDECCLPKRAG